MSGEDTLHNGLPRDEFTPDLEPAEASSMLIGEPGLWTADVKELYGPLSDFSKGDQERIPIVPQGVRLQSGAVFLDLADHARGTFIALGSEVVEFDHYSVPRARVDYLLWNRLVSVSDPARLDEADRP